MAEAKKLCGRRGLQPWANDTRIPLPDETEPCEFPAGHKGKCSHGRPVSEFADDESADG